MNNANNTADHDERCPACDRKVKKWSKVNPSLCAECFQDADDDVLFTNVRIVKRTEKKVEG